MRAKVQAAQEHVRRGKSFRQAGVLERALVEYRQAVELDPSISVAVVGAFLMGAIAIPLIVVLIRGRDRVRD